MNQKGIAPLIIILIIAGVLILGGGIYYISQKGYFSANHLPAPLPSSTPTISITAENVSDISGGIGAELEKTENGSIIIISLLKDMPAEKSGLLAGDEIIKIDNKPTRDSSIEEVVKLIRGKPGTEVVLTIYRKDWEKNQDFKIVRAIMEEASYASIICGAIFDESSLFSSKIPFDGSLKEFNPARGGTLPDLDLHAVTSDGRHAGVNYQTGEFDQIEGAILSGDNGGSPEWILLPKEANAKFFVSSRDNQKFLEENPDIALKMPDKSDSFEIYARCIDPKTDIYTSPTITNQQINPGQEIYYEISGTTDVKISSSSSAVDR